MLKESHVSFGPHEAWIGVQQRVKNSWSISSMSPGLYDGQLGVALMYCLAAASGKSDRNWRAALRCIEQIDTSQLTTLGLYSGLAGYAFVNYVLWRVSEDEASLHRMDRCLAAIAREARHCRSNDIISGLAGPLSVVLEVYGSTHAGSVLELAVMLGDLLCRNVGIHKGSRTVFWSSTAFPSGSPGYAHGNAGIAANLVRLSIISGDTRYLDLAGSALAASVRFRKDPEAVAVWNTRTVRAAKTPAGTWCHGDSGLLLAIVDSIDNLRLIGHDDAAAFAVEQLSIPVMPEDSDCLCHGQLGNAVIRAYCAAKMGFPAAAQEAHAQQVAVFKRFIEDRFKAGIPHGLGHPGLMTGYGGVYMTAMMSEAGLDPILLFNQRYIVLEQSP